MVIHSYANSLSSVRAFNRGFNRALEHDRNPSVLNYYMNTLNRQSERHKVTAGHTASRVINDFKPEIIVAVGEEAQEYLTKKYIDIAGIQIVYAKIKDPQIYGYDKAKNVSGVKEKFPLDEVIKVLSDIRPGKALNVASIGDQTTLMRVDDHYLTNHSWAPHTLKNSIMVSNFEEWKKAIRKLNDLQDVDFIMLSSYQNLKTSFDDSRIVPPQEVIDWTAYNSEIPLVGLYETNSRDGAPIAVSTSSLAEGKTTAKIVLDLIEKRKTTAGNNSTEHFLISLNQKYPMYKKLKVPEIYRSFAMASGLYYESEKRDGKYKL